MNKDFFWNPQKTLDHKMLFNFIVGPRSVGKTYGCLKFVINRHNNFGEEFVYIRRFDTELEKTNLEKIFDAHISNMEFPENELTVKGKTFYKDGVPLGYAIPLTKAGLFKSVPFPNVKWIIFDEFMLNSAFHKYLPNEPDMFMELYNTIGRFNDPVVFFLGNAITMANPYFLKYELDLPYNKSINKRKDIDMLVEVVQAPEFKEEMKKTRVAKIMEYTGYGSYSIDNEFLIDSKQFIKKRGPKCYGFFDIYTAQKTLHVWKGEDGLYICENPDNNYEVPQFAFSLAEHTIQTSYKSVFRGSYFCSAFLQAFSLGMLFYENQKVKSLSYQILSKLI